VAYGTQARDSADAGMNWRSNDLMTWNEAEVMREGPSYEARLDTFLNISVLCSVSLCVGQLELVVE
jgi:hypothetical protein